LRVLFITLLAERGNDLLVRFPFDSAGTKDSSLTTRGLDLLFKPLKILVCLLVKGQ